MAYLRQPSYPPSDNCRIRVVIGTKRLVMEKKNRNEELQSRREFFKRAAKGALPILAAVVLAGTPTIMKAAEKAPMGCNNSCSVGCGVGCAGHCTGTCSAACRDRCQRHCDDGCYNSCRVHCTAISRGY